MTEVTRTTFIVNDDGNTVQVDAETESNWIGLTVENDTIGATASVRLAPEDTAWLIRTLASEITSEALPLATDDSVPPDALQRVLEAAVAYAHEYHNRNATSPYGLEIIKRVKEAGLLNDD